MRPRPLAVLVVLLALLVAGCGGSSSDTATPGGAGSTFSTADCPTENTRSFAKTRFVADVGGSIFLVNRYLVQPYRAGTFAKGANGRTAALIKAGLATAVSVKLLKNATENAKANPTLCKTVAAPLSQISAQLDGLVDKLRSGSVDPATMAGLGGLVGTIQQKARDAGIPVQEQPVPLG